MGSYKYSIRVPRYIEDLPRPQELVKLAREAYERGELDDVHVGVGDKRHWSLTFYSTKEKWDLPITPNELVGKYIKKKYTPIQVFLDEETVNTLNEIVKRTEEETGIYLNIDFEKLVPKLIREYVEKLRKNLQ